MSIFEEARAFIFIADHVATDSVGKLTALGLGFQITMLQQSGLTASQFVAVIIDVPSKFAGQEFSMSIELRDDDADAAVKLQGPTGQPEALRIQQLAKVQAPNVQGLYLPASVPARVNAVLAFPNGLPLAAGKSYTWRLEIDGNHRKGWSAQFHVAGPPPAPVFGGPVGPANIPSVPPIPTVDE